MDGLRWEVDQGTYDPLDYQAGSPNGFTTLAKKYVKQKEWQGLKSIGNTRNYIKQACKYFGQKNVKQFKRSDIRDFLDGLQDISNKTKHNYMSCLRDFFRNLYEDEIIDVTQIPRMPKVDYELGYRNITDIETQGQIIAKVKEAISIYLTP